MNISLLNIERYKAYWGEGTHLFKYCENAYEYANEIKVVLKREWNSNPPFTKAHTSYIKTIRYRCLNQKTRLSLAVKAVVPKEFWHIYWTAMWHMIDVNHVSNSKYRVRYLFDGFPGKDELVDAIVIWYNYASLPSFDKLDFSGYIALSTRLDPYWIVSTRFENVVPPMKKSIRDNRGDNFYISDQMTTRFLKDFIELQNAMSYDDAI